MKIALPFTAATALLSVSLVPAVSHGASERDALNACSEVMLERVERDLGVPILSYRIGNDSEHSSRRLTQALVFTMSAANPETDEVIARARCFVNERARVRRLTTLPLDAEDGQES